MSGIAAVFDRSGAVSEDDFEAVFRRLDHRGSDGADVETFDRVALGHQHLYTTPEEVGERQPVEVDGLWVVVDGRVDNRAALFEQLADAGAPASADVSDAELVLHAYRAFGEAFLERLVGAFALAIWDPEDARLLVARDKTGIRKLYYADVGSVVVVASEMQAVLQHPAVSTDINEGFLGEVLASHYVTHEETFYADVDPVLTGSKLSVTAGGARGESYWEAWNADVERDSDKDLAEEFRDRLREAVACRLRAPTYPGIMMSGGLDSTVIAGLAREHLDRTGRPDADLHSYTLVMDDADGFEDELDRVEATVEAFDLAPHTVPVDDHYVLKDVDRYERAARESPVFGPIAIPCVPLYDVATGDGRTVLLLGIGGNLYDGSRLYYTDLLRRGRFGTFLRDALADPLSLRQVVTWFGLAQFSDRFGQFLMEWTGRADPDVPEWIDDDFAARTGLAERASREPETGIDSAAKDQQYKRFFRRARRFEDAVQRQVALRAGAEFRLPYLDSRLVSFAVSLPPGSLLEAGEDKALFRRATEGLLPESVRTQSAAVTFDSIVRRGLYEERREYVEDLFDDSALVARGIADEDAFEDHVAETFDPEGGQRPIWELLATELWLRHWR